MADLPETSELLAFIQVVDSRSLSRAAHELRLPRSTVGRRLQRLEEKLGVRLLKRSTRQQALTDAGQDFYQQARAALTAIEQASHRLHPRGGAIDGRVRISVPSTSTMNGMFIAFAQRFPAVCLEIDASSAHVDLVSGGYDLAIRGSSMNHPGLVARQLGKMQTMACASPAYLAAHGTPKRVSDLRQHQLITPFFRGEHPLLDWPLRNGRTVRIQTRMTGNTVELLRDASLAGMGISLVPDMMIRTYLDAGQLVPVLPKRVGAASSLSLVFREKELMAPAVRALVDFIVEWDPAARFRAHPGA